MSAKAIKNFIGQLETAKYDLERFQTRFEQDPANALSWGLGAFQNAARRKVLIDAIAALSAEGSTVEHVCRGLRNRLMNKSRWPAQSTSPTANLMEQYELAALTEAVEYLESVEQD